MRSTSACAILCGLQNVKLSTNRKEFLKIIKISMKNSHISGLKKIIHKFVASVATLATFWQAHH